MVQEAESSQFRSVGADSSGNPRRVELVCYYCAGSAIYDDEKWYVRHDGKLKAAWHHAQKKSKFAASKGQEEKMVRRALEALEQKHRRRNEEGGDATHG